MQNKSRKNLLIKLKQASRRVQAEVLILHSRMGTPHGRLEEWLNKMKIKLGSGQETIIAEIWRNRDVKLWSHYEDEDNQQWIFLTKEQFEKLVKAWMQK